MSDVIEPAEREVAVFFLLENWTRTSVLYFHSQQKALYAHAVDPPALSHVPPLILSLGYRLSRDRVSLKVSCRVPYFDARMTGGYLSQTACDTACSLLTLSAEHRSLSCGGNWVFCEQCKLFPRILNGCEHIVIRASISRSCHAAVRQGKKIRFAERVVLACRRKKSVVTCHHQASLSTTLSISHLHHSLMR